MNLSIIILAAGQGTRMYSKLPKVLHRLGGKTLLEHVVATAQQLTTNIFVVYGFGAEQVKTQLQHLRDVHWVFQQSQQGTAHAVLQAIPHIPDNHQVLILVGDCPLVSVEILQQLIAATNPNGVGLVVTKLADPSGMGRLLRNQSGNVIGIIEERDASTDQKQITEINTGIITAPAIKLKQWLLKIKNVNAQQEFYLTDIISLAVQEKLNVHAVNAQNSEDVMGINDRVQLATMERILQKRLAEQLMLRGVTLYDPARIDIRGEVTTGQDIVIDVNVILEGQISIGDHCNIGPNCYLKNVTIGNHVTINANTVIEDAVIENDCTIGPFARLRPQTHLKNQTKVGNFVEIKKTIVGENSKINHLSYIGDAIIGKDVNIGAGCITCNYDGVNKYQTLVQDGAFIGSDCQLVAPVTIEAKAYIASGSTITQNAPAGKLTIARARQTTIENWTKPLKKGKEKIE